MSFITTIRRTRHLSRRKAWALVEAIATLAAASAMIRLMTFRRVVALAEKPQGRTCGARPEALALVRWAIERAAGQVPWRTVCFQKALAAHFMLRRRGIESCLHYGVRQREGQVEAHVWLVADSQIVTGEDVAAEFQLVATFAPPPIRRSE